MDLRQWFLLSARPKADDVYNLVSHVPCSEYRCLAVMELFVQGTKTGFKLTDAHGQPTETLRELVRLISGELCPVADLPPEERRNFTDHKGVMDPVFKERWFIRNISIRLRLDGGATGYYGWAGRMFLTDQHKGLLEKRVTETIEGTKQRPTRYVVACPPDWELTDHVYYGLYRWRYAYPKKLWPTYDLLAYVKGQSASKERKGQRRKGVAASDGSPGVATA